MTTGDLPPVHPFLLPLPQAFLTTTQNIDLGDHCWLGANVVITPGVVLGPHTVVGANAVVTKGFPEGHCVLGGVPAKVIKRLDNTLEKEADR